MAKYMLFKYDDKQFESGDHIKMYPVKRIELTEDELWNLKGLVVFFLNSINVQQKPEFTIRIINKKLDKVLK